MTAGQQNSKTARVILAVSLILNIFFATLIAYKHSGHIREFVTNAIAPRAINDTQLKEFNRNHGPIIVEGKVGNENARKLKLLIIGNSLSYVPASDSPDWKHSGGMAASNIENDYAHLLMKELVDRKGVQIEYMISNLAEFERNFKN